MREEESHTESNTGAPRGLRLLEPACHIIYAIMLWSLLALLNSSRLDITWASN